MLRVKKFSQNFNLITIIFCTLFFWILRIPSLFEPYYYGDEMIYLTVGNGLRSGLSLYSEIWDNKTPLLYVVAALSGNLFYFRLLSGLFMFLSIYFIYKTVKTIAKTESRLPLYVAAISTVLLSLPVFEVFIANAENFFILPTSAAIYFLSKFLKNERPVNLFYSGVLLGIAVCFKVPTLADFFVAIGVLIATSEQNMKSIKRIVSQSLFLTTGFALPIVLTIFWYAINNNFSSFLESAVIGNIGYSTSWRGEGGTTTQLAILSLVFVVAILFLWHLKRVGKVSSLFVLSSIWLLGSLTGSLLSSRPYPHYLIQTLPALSIIISIMFFSVKKQQVYTVIVLTIYLFFIQKVDFWIYDAKTYIDRVTGLLNYGNKDTTYLSLFGENVVYNYEASKIVKQNSKPDQKIFVWGDSAPIYALSNRIPATKYTAYYHVDEFLGEEGVCEKLKQTPAQLLVIDLSRQDGCLKEIASKNYQQISKTSKYEFWQYTAKE